MELVKCLAKTIKICDEEVAQQANEQMSNELVLSAFKMYFSCKETPSPKVEATPKTTPTPVPTPDSIPIPILPPTDDISHNEL